MTATSTPREIDTQLAAAWHEIHETEGKIARVESTIMHYAGAQYYYRGRQRVTDMKLGEALEIVVAAIAYGDEYKSTHSTVEPDGYVSTDWREYDGAVAPYDLRKLPETLERRTELLELLDEQRDEVNRLDHLYTGWSRFFLVTSSAGHVHSSTHCSTCRPTTRFGWLPELSGKTEADAVGELGPTLCSVCFPSAPVDWTTGKKITAAQAAKKAA